VNAYETADSPVTPELDLLRTGSFVSKEVVYFHISVSVNPFVASVTLDKLPESDFFVLFIGLTLTCYLTTKHLM
jgi:hypothetical protein